MDRFLDKQNEGTVVDSRNEFTVDRRRSRKKLLESIPKGPRDAPYRLFDAAVRHLGVRPIEAMSYYAGDNNRPASLTINLPGAHTSYTADLLAELRAPFSQNLMTSTMARAIFRAVGLGARVDLTFGKYLQSLMGRSAITLTPNSLDIADDLGLPATNGLIVAVTQISELQDYREYGKWPVRKVLKHFKHPERLAPLESFSKEVQGYFDYRTRPFTAIRSYAPIPEDWREESLLLDLFEGPYVRLDDQTTFLDKRKPGRFLFIRWRPHYGCPTFLHHSLDNNLVHQEQKCRATFWIETTGSAATVHFYSQGLFSNPVQMKGPVGLTGIVLWPGLTYDLWGTKLVKNDDYDRALQWTQEQVDKTSACLQKHLPDLLERVQDSNLIKKSYVDETVAKMKVFWG